MYAFFLSAPFLQSFGIVMPEAQVQAFHEHLDEDAMGTVTLDEMIAAAEWERKKLIKEGRASGAALTLATPTKAEALEIITGSSYNGASPATSPFDSKLAAGFFANPKGPAGPPPPLPPAKM